jgi:hypothetical protein
VGGQSSFLKRQGYKAFGSVLAKLRVELAPARPVIIRKKVFQESFPAMTFGECVRRPERFVIRLNARMDQNMAIETLCYEPDTPVGEELMAANELLLHLQHLRNRLGSLPDVGFGIGGLWLRRVHMLQGSARPSSALHFAHDFQPS